MFLTNSQATLILFVKDHSLTTIILTTQSPGSTEIDLIHILHLGVFLGSFLKLLPFVELHAFSSWFCFLKKLVSSVKIREGGRQSLVYFYNMLLKHPF